MDNGEALLLSDDLRQEQEIGLAGLQEHLDRDLARVRERLGVLARPASGKAEEPIMYAVEQVGRLFRPTLVLASFYLVQNEFGAGTPQEVIDTAASVELLHVATLCHDDLIDNAAIRRGKPTAGARYGSDVGLLIGDYLLACCMRIAAGLGVSQTSVMSDTLIQMCLGQIEETRGLYDPLRTEEDYLSAISGKTAYLMRAASMMGAMRPDVGPDTQEVLAGFGHNLGMAFQIWDDILDLFGTDTGKEPAQDLRNGVYTLPIIYALDKFPDHLVGKLRDQTVTAEELQELVRVINDSGATSRAAATARRRVADAVRSVKTHPVFADRAPLVERCLLGLIAKLAPRHPAIPDLHAVLEPAEG